MSAPQKTIAAARKLRRTLSVPEALRLRERAPDRPASEVSIARTHVRDFYCLEVRLAVDIDGRAHGTDNRPERDARRDAWRAAQGVEVVRVAVRDVFCR